jgi:exopolysaccharide biosynthesis polyprenyl glycosylphosphotransferase
MESLQSRPVDLGLAPTLPWMKPRPLPATYAGWQKAVLVASDLTILIAAGALALRLAGVSVAAVIERADVVMALAFTATIALLLYERVGLYRTSFSALARDQIYASFSAAALGTIPPVLLLLLLPALAPFRGTLALAALFSAIGLPAARFALHAVSSRLAPPAPRRIAIAGNPDRVDALPRDMSLTTRDAVLRLPIAHFDDELAGVASENDLLRLPWFANALAWNCDTLIVTEALPPALMPAILRVTEARGIKLAFAPLRLRPHACDFRVRRDGGVALLYPRSLAVCSKSSNFTQRAFDLALVVPALLLLSPVLLALALAVLLEGGGNVIYRQTRVGRFGKEFSMLKFRTMQVDAEKNTGPVWARAGETRVTRVGRFLRRTSLDELPQLLNVLRGEMSIVGPRPERPFYVEQFRAMLPRFAERHMVRPGITGWAQINMRRTLQPSAISDKLSYDLFYLENWSVFLDLTIVLKTGAEFLFQRPS